MLIKMMVKLPFAANDKERTIEIMFDIPSGDKAVSTEEDIEENKRNRRGNKGRK